MRTDPAIWEEAIRDAERDERAAEVRLRELREERAAYMRAWNERRNDAKRDLRDAVKAKKSAAYALKTGREPR